MRAVYRVLFVTSLAVVPISREGLMADLGVDNERRICLAL
jgi:hypothetical protein